MKTIPRLRFVALGLACLAVATAAETQSPLVEAVRVRTAPAWQALLQQKADVNARDDAGNTALHHAALNHDLAAVTALLAAGAEVDARNAAEATPLLYGAGHVAIARALLARGASVNAVSTLKNTPLLVAAAYPDSLAAVEVLLAAGADLHAKKADNLEVVLSRAAGAGDGRTVDLLIARGAAKDAASAAAALGAAASLGYTAIVDRLLAAGADPNRDPVFVGHALNKALWSGHLGLAQRLMEKGADVNLRSPSGHGTPPMVWAGYNQPGDPAIAKALVARGLDVNTANDQGGTALSWALRNDPHSEVVAYLRSVGAKEPPPARVKPLPNREVPATPSARTALARERIPATLALLQRSSDAFLDNGFVQKAGCTSCHGQDMLAVSLGLARERGLAIDEISFGRQLTVQLKRWNARVENARQMTSPVAGAPTSVVYGLWGLKAAGYPADAMTDAMVRWLLRVQRPAGRWNDPTRRPPMEDGAYVATGWSTLSVRDYAPAGYAKESAAAQASAARWLAANEPVSHNEAVMQLLGLYWSGGTTAAVEKSVARLVRTQRPDGGWSQLPNLESDAWATGSALVALCDGGGMKPTDPVYQRGVAYLLRTQFEDGSWWVKTRTWAFQPHFNSQFPHGRDQWISQGGTAWAVMALLRTMEPVTPAAAAPAAPALMAVYAKSPAAQRKKAEVAAAPNSAAAAAVSFERDIRPILERSCTECHGGQKPRAGLALESREALLKGGASGEPAIAPGYADDSTLIQYVLGKYEDLEMPPLDRREKFPALTKAEIELLRTWIDAGAPWIVAKSGGDKPAVGQVEE